MLNLCDNKFVFTTLFVIVQIILIFSFLVVFYFSYITKVETDEFKRQIDLIMKNVLNDKNILDLIPKQSVLSDDELKSIINGAIDNAQERVTRDNQEDIDNIHRSNMKLQNLSYIVVGILLLVVIFLYVMFYRCMTEIIKEALIVTFFVGLTEFIFLTIISKRYIAADPNKIKFLVGQSIENWLIKNKNI